MSRSSAEIFAEDNDNLALFAMGVLEKLFETIGIDSTEGSKYPVYFRARWSVIEQKPGARDVMQALGQGALVPELTLQYVVDRYVDHNHTNRISPFDEYLELEVAQIAQIERLADSH